MPDGVSIALSTVQTLFRFFLAELTAPLWLETGSVTELLLMLYIRYNQHPADRGQVTLRKRKRILRT